MSVQSHEIWTNRQDYQQQKYVTYTVSGLEHGEILVRIDQFALTSNNVSYALSGDAIGYWHYFPPFETKDTWGKVPVWGLATVIQSECADIAVGEQLYGFFPMASHLILSPASIKQGYFTDGAIHRRDLPPLYNQYMRTQSEPDFYHAFANERCLFFPLFITGYVIADFLLDQDWFQADQVIISSISSKTGLSCASFIKAMGYKGQMIGITSPANVDFVKSLGCVDQIIPYGAVESLDRIPSVYIDMSGSGDTRKTIHSYFADQLHSSQVVGATHWSSERTGKGLDGPRPEFFFAPAQIAKRNKDWGPGVIMEKGYSACADLAVSMKGKLTIEDHEGSEAVMAFWQEFLNNKISGQRGIMLRL